MTYFVYIVQCHDQTYYIGCTNDVPRRVKEHNRSVKGAKYTRTRRPVELVYTLSFTTLSEAMRKEREMKKLSRVQKEVLCKNYEPTL
jgi:putative endonuclease